MVRLSRYRPFSGLSWRSASLFITTYGLIFEHSPDGGTGSSWCRSDPSLSPRKQVQNFCYNEHKPTAHLVVSTYEEELDWLTSVGMNATVYVHNRSQTNPDPERHYSSRGLFALARARESQQRVAEWARLHPTVSINFTTIPNSIRLSNEDVPYLNYIVENYHALPEVVFFVHGHACAKHQFFSAVPMLEVASRCFSRLAEGKGYLNLNELGRLVKKFPQRYELKDFDADFGRVRQVHRLWDSLVGDVLGPVPQSYSLDCCAQFGVSRQNLRSYPRDFYVHLIKQVASGERRTLMEFFWRPIFVRDFEGTFKGTYDRPYEIYRPNRKRPSTNTTVPHVRAQPKAAAAGGATAAVTTPAGRG